MNFQSLLEAYHGLPSTQTDNQDSSGDIVANKISSLTQARQNKISAIGIPSDGDSGQGWRLANVDAPETYHDDPRTRTKVYSQYGYANRLTDFNKVKEQVDAEGEAYRVAREAGQDLGAEYARLRREGVISKDTPISTYEMYHLGDRAKEQALAYQEANPTKGIQASTLTDNVDPYGRYLAENDDYVNTQIRAGYLVPDATDPDKFKEQQRLYNLAVANEEGLHSDTTSRQILDAINATSHSSMVNEPKYDTSDSIFRAATSSVGAAVGSVANLLGDTITGIAKEVDYALHNGEFQDRAEHQKDFNKRAMNAMAGTILEKDFKVRNGALDYTGHDESMKQEYWGYKHSEELTQATTDMEEGFKAGDYVKVAKTAVGLFGQPAVLAELFAGSTAEMALAATGYGSVALALAKANEFLEYRSNLSGEPNTREDYAIAIPAGMIYAYVNKFTGGNMGLKMLRESAKQLVADMPKAGLISLAQVTKDILQKGGKAYGIEAGEEAVQTLAEIIGEKLNTKEHDQVFSRDTAATVVASAALGGATGKAVYVVGDAPKRLSEMRKNNKPLNDVIKTANSLSAEERGLVIDELNATKYQTNVDIQVNNAKVNVLNSVFDESGNIDPEKLKDRDFITRVGQTIAELNPEARSEIISKYADSLKQFFNIPEETAQGKQELDSTIAEAIRQIQDSPEIKNSKEHLEALDSIMQGINGSIPTSIFSDMLYSARPESPMREVFQGILNSVGSLEYSQQISEENSKFNGFTSLSTLNREAITTTNIKNTVDTLNQSTKNLTTDLGPLEFAIGEMQRAQDNAIGSVTTESVRTDVMAILNGKDIQSTLMGMRRITEQLEKYDTPSLKAMLQEVKENQSKHPYTNKMYSAINSVIRARGQAGQKVGFDTGKSASHIYNDTLTKGGDEFAALRKAVRSSTLTAQEAKTFTELAHALNRLSNSESKDGRLSDNALNNILKRIDKIKQVEPEVNTNSNTNTKQDTTENTQEPAKDTDTNTDNSTGSNIDTEPEVKSPEEVIEDINENISNSVKQDEILNQPEVVTTPKEVSELKQLLTEVSQPELTNIVNEFLTDEVVAELAKEGIEVANMESQDAKNNLVVTGILNTMCK